MKWHWLRDKEVLEQPIVYWERGAKNGADYFTKKSPSDSPPSNATSLQTYLKFIKENDSYPQIIQEWFEPIPI